MNTHPTHTRVCVGWGLQPLIVPIGVDVFFVVFIVPTTPWPMGGVFGCVHVFFMHFLERWCVCGMCFSSLSNIVNYRNILYLSTNCDSEIASPTLVENPHSLCGSHENYYPVAQKIVASFKDQREYIIFLVSIYLSEF